MSADYVLDTNIVLHFTRSGSPVANQIEVDYQLLQSAFKPIVSVVTIGELLAFAQAFQANRVSKLETILKEFLVVDLNRKEILDAYASIHKYCKSGTNISHNDLWIAATAMAMDATIITTDQDLLRLPAGTVKLIQVNSKTGVTETKA